MFGEWYGQRFTDRREAADNSGWLKALGEADVAPPNRPLAPRNALIGRGCGCVIFPLKSKSRVRVVLCHFHFTHFTADFGLLICWSITYSVNDINKP
jgi:hypothetical protein